MTKDAPAPGFRKRAAHELKDFAAIAAYLAILLCAIVAYTNLVSKKYDDAEALTYTFALVNALIIAKIILIGEMLHLGRRLEFLPISQSCLLKSLIFAVLVFLFHLVEESVKRLIHHQPSGSVLHNLHYEELAARSIIILCAFIPLFAIRELRRVLGPKEFHDLLFQRRSLAPQPPPSPAPTKPQ